MTLIKKNRLLLISIALITLGGCGGGGGSGSGSTQSNAAPLTGNASYPPIPNKVEALPLTK
jgi:hypothetical protein